MDPSLLVRLAGYEEDPTADAALADPDPPPSTLEKIVSTLRYPDRDIVEMVFWGCLPKAEVARLLGLHRSYVHRVVRQTLDLLREPLPLPEELAPPVRRDPPERHHCEYESEWGPCQQEVRRPYTLCPYHWRMLYLPRFRVDRAYHEKIARGLLQPADSYLTQTELDAMFRGHSRHDGRRLDHYTKR